MSPLVREELVRLLEAYRAGEIKKEELIDLIMSQGYTDLGHSKVDTSRLYRTGFPEVVFCANKTDQEIIDISGELLRKNGFVLLTRAKRSQYEALRAHLPEAVFHERASLIAIGPGIDKRGAVSVVSAGTSDEPVAEEASVTAELFGSNVSRIYDAGVAGLHRLLSHRDRIASSNVIVAVAGMEGALPSVVGGLFGIPVIGVPTSVGYGAGFGGLAPLLSMLNSCAPGVCVLNIDNGFGAGYLAALINKKIEDVRESGD
jgi:NCAIR mutase (PurE)-related protein